MKKKNKQRYIKTTTVATCITKPMVQGILRVLKTNAHVNISDYLRDLIRKDLEKRGITFENQN